MQKDYRNFLRYDGKELTAIDISNSQPFLDSSGLNVPPVAETNVPGIAETNVPAVAE